MEKGYIHRAPTVKGTILVVDDNPMSRDLLIRRLTHFGFEAIPCADPTQVIDTMDIAAFDLILLEIIMERISGFEILKQIKRHKVYGYLPVIVISHLKKSMQWYAA